MNSIVAGLLQIFSNPVRLVEWTKSCIAELINSAINDVNQGLFFAYLTRWRQPDEMYYRALYILFVATIEELPHVVSGELPNSVKNMQSAVNAAKTSKGKSSKSRTVAVGQGF